MQKYEQKQGNIRDKCSKAATFDANRQKTRNMTTTAKGKTVRSRRQAFVDRYRKSAPDLDYDDDEVLDGKIADSLDDYDRLRRERDDFNAMLTDPKNEYAAPIISGLATGKNADGSDFDLAAWIVENEPDVLIDKIDGNADWRERLDKRRAARRKDEEERRSWTQTWEKKVAAEDAEIDKAMQEGGYRQEDAASLLDWMYDKDNGLLARALRLELKAADFSQLFRMKNYDADVRRADSDGYVRGRNEKIDLSEHKSMRRNRMPVLPSGGGSRMQEEEDPTLQRLRAMKGY